MFGSANCTQAPSEAKTDAGVAGAGVLLSFIITNGLALLLSAYIIILNLRKSSEAKIVRKLLLSFSDQQIITGIGIQSIGLAKMETMIPYHFFIVWMLSLLSTSTHLATLLALVNDFKRDWVLRWLRQFLMFINLILSSVFGIFVLKSVMKNLAPALPIGCVWTLPSKNTPSNAGISIAGTIAVIAGNCIVFALCTWYLHNRNNQKWLKIIQVAGMLVLIATGIGATIRVILLSQAFGTPSVPLEDTGEKDWSFGQLLPLLLLLLPLISAIEIFRGEMKVPHSTVDDEHTPLFNGELEDKPDGQVRTSFQPNPLWGSQSNLFRK
ncbi:hypothetical protein K432DRAFT_359925 [Lepidopterella palustris CBS 459.81]|uniref:Uncharacterized protein n=1 Tax=Lepidopterella palustris CBS 459.81 TaxID=1314670 RepID=A0A8E2E3T0_9PEZI|nr:hypothetical protein K432DRAFT_359925 [Lepidopterella palustris CBS 459.81]